MIRLAVLGASGRTGSRVPPLVADDERFELVAALVAPNDPRLGEQIRVGEHTVTLADNTEAPFDVLIDFSTPAGTERWLTQCVRSGAAMVTGVTGHSASQLKRIEEASASIAIVKSSNFSVGINLLLAMVGDVARRLGDAYDIEIIEQHHNRKVDAPSGTALSLTEAIVEATGRDGETDVVYGRHGTTGVRPQQQIGVHAVRMGSVVGRHEVHFSAAGETVTLRHVAHTRDTFARGALEAAAWLTGKGPGMYTMPDVLSSPSGRV